MSADTLIRVKSGEKRVCVCMCVSQSALDDEQTEQGRLRGQEHDGNAWEGGEAGPWHAQLS